MNRYLLLILCLLLSLNAIAARKSNGALLCLAKEEEAYHKKRYTGPLYTLNQKLILNLAEIDHVTFMPGVIDRICSSRKISPSYKLLKLCLLDGKRIFELKQNKDTMVVYDWVDHQLAQGFIEQCYDIFFKYSLSIQSMSKTPRCLQYEVPALHNILNNLKYVREHVKLREVFASVPTFETIIDIMAYPHLVIQNCDKKAKLLKSKKRKVRRRKI